MAIQVYKDDACTQLVKVPQKFTRSSTTAPYQVFALTKMLGTELAHLYKFNGTTHVKLIKGTDYTISSNNITIAVGLSATDVLIAMPTDRLNLNFGGVYGATKTSAVPVVFKREALYMYDSLVLASENLDLEPFSLSYVDTAVTFVANQSMTSSGNTIVTGSKCTSTAITGLTINALTGYALVLNNTFIGTIIANEIDSILVDNVSYSRAGVASDDLNIISVGTLLFALDVNGSVPVNASFKPVVTLPNLQPGTDTVKVWIKQTLTIPEVATNYPNMAFKISGIEYLA